MAIYALTSGVNRYGSGMDLAGCVPDAQGWTAALADRGATVETLLDGDASRANILSAIGGILRRAKRGDTAVITWSGHGSRVPDMDGDEPDRFDETICPADIMATGRHITDDELYQTIVRYRAEGARVVFISDSCHSGTVTRFAAPLIPKDRMRRARYLPPELFLEGLALQRARALPSRATTAPPRHPNLLMGGCEDREFSYDAWFGDRPNGAFTRVALDTLAELPVGSTYRQWHARIQRRLPSIDYPQSPSLDGTTAQKAWVALA